jgi:uridine kinase
MGGSGSGAVLASEMVSSAVGASPLGVMKTNGADEDDSNNAIKRVVNSESNSSGQSSPRDKGIPRVIYEKMPNDIVDRYVLLLDPILATGVSSMAAIDRLLKLGVREDRIMFVTVIAASQGIHTLASKYPSMKIITSEVDAGLNELNRVVPGVGEFGDRYFGTEDTIAQFDFEENLEMSFE